MFNEFLESGFCNQLVNKKVLGKFARESSTFNAGYFYWREELFERIMRLFVWENTYDWKENTGVKPKEIELRLLLAGHTGITKIKDEDELTAMFGNFYGVAKYFDEKPNYMVRCPVYAGSRKVNEDVVVIDNNSVRNPAMRLVHHYAILLAHTEVTLVNLLVNARDSGGIPVATTQKQKTSIEEYQGRIFNGQYGTVTDIGNLGLSYVGSDRKTYQSLSEVMIMRERLLKSFYSDIGVRSAFEKRSNAVEAEVEADTSMLLLNISDMIECRKKGADAVNNLFGTNWSVHIAEEIDYGTENERIQFDSATEIHKADEVVEKGVIDENSK